MRRDLEPIARQLTGEREERRPVEVRLRDAGHEVGRTGTERRDADTGDTRRGGHRVGHERGGCLVTREDELEPGRAESLDEIDDLAARMTEHAAHARVA